MKKIPVDYTEENVNSAKYRTLPKISPYSKVDPSRYENTKSIFKHVGEKLKTITNPGQKYTFCDVACSNGEFLYYLKKTFPNFELNGFDFEPHFIQAGRDYPGLQGVNLQVSDMFKLEGQYDFVSIMGTIQTFWDPTPALTKLLSLVKPGGYLFMDGYFNPYDIEMRCSYMDNSTETGKGIWRRDWNIYSQSGIRAFLDGKCKNVVFEDVVLDVDIPQRPEAPHINAWSFKDDKGRRHITSGLRMLLDDVMLIVQK